jgi:CheY-like chemotaxis protein
MPVLIVDDNETNRRMLEAAVTRWGMRATIAEGGVRALAAMARAVSANDAFRLVLLDARMPEMDGFAVAERIHADPSLAGATVLMLTSDREPGDVARCREFGVAAYLIKPIRTAELLATTRRILGGAVAEAGERGQFPSVAVQPAPRDVLRILLVEDNPVNQRVVERMLHKLGHFVTLAGDGVEALAILERHPADVVFMDVQMPGMNGLEATVEIRQREALRGVAAAERLPIIALTANAMASDVEECRRAGMDAHIAKPVRTRDLIDALVRVARYRTAA